MTEGGDSQSPGMKENVPKGNERMTEDENCTPMECNVIAL
jgi:hypothetical protein